MVFFFLSVSTKKCVTSFHNVTVTSMKKSKVGPLELATVGTGAV